MVPTSARPVRVQSKAGFKASVGPTSARPVMVQSKAGFKASVGPYTEPVICQCLPAGSSGVSVMCHLNSHRDRQRHIHSLYRQQPLCSK